MIIPVKPKITMAEIDAFVMGISPGTNAIQTKRDKPKRRNCTQSRTRRRIRKLAVKSVDTNPRLKRVLLILAQELKRYL